ncbi:hypothetical protein BGZ73_004237 [Actinomortierella ambigua]|nr:hypothetical protein BGZ73_004237 [Actinomortierella ambigua]
MALLTSPLAAACQSMLTIDKSLSSLPANIRHFCGENLKHFIYDDDSSSSPTQLSTLEDYAQAIHSLLATARLNNQVLEDIIQAMASTWKPPFDLEGFMAVTAACFYRIMSISTTIETKRLLTGCLPAVLAGYGEEAMRSLIRFQPPSTEIGADDNAELRTNENALSNSLQQYWKQALEPGFTMQAKLASNAIGLLAFLETLVDLAISPLGQSLGDHKRQMLASVYANDIGFDLTVDKVVSSSLVAFKTYAIDWAVISTDKMLVAFFLLCRLSHIVDTALHSPASTRRMLSTTPALQDIHDEVAVPLRKVTMAQYETMLPPASPDIEADMAARIKKAHDELLLACMTHAENILKRLDIGQAVSELRSGRGKKGLGISSSTSMSALLQQDCGTEKPTLLETSSSILKPMDRECLEAALHYLPAQEQSALRARLATAFA